MDHHLEGVVVCISGDPRFDKDDNQHIRDQFTDENVSRWLKYRGGRLDEEVTKATTHLICSKLAYKSKGNPKVKAARKYRCEIVTYEWLTDTFQLWDYQRKKAPPDLYHPGKPRDGDAITKLFKKSEKKAKAVKKKSPAAADTTAVEHEDDAGAAGEVDETGMKQLTISEEKVSQVSSEETDPPRVSEAGEESGTKVVNDRKEASMPIDKESGKPIGKPENSAKSKDQEPPVDLSLYVVCKDESGLHQIEVCKPDKHGNGRGYRWVLELFESKSEPKTYLFGGRKYPSLGSSFCIRRFPSKAPGDKEREFNKYRASFQKLTQVNWDQRDSIPSKGPYYYRSPAVSGQKIGSNSHENMNDLGREKNGNPTSSDAVPHRQRDGERGETSSKRKSDFSEVRPAKAFKVTKPPVVGDSTKDTNGGPKTA